MLLYDVTSEHSFLNVREWITAVEVCPLFKWKVNDLA